MKFSRVWAMASPDTFSVQPIGEFVQRYLKDSMTSIDPFARNCDWATYTNDLNPDTTAAFHMDALDFLQLMVSKKVKADLVIFDPAYSPRQVKEVYDSIGHSMGREGAQRTHGWTVEKDLIDDLLVDEGIVLSFGWNSQGMGQGRGYEIIEVLLVCHGVGHNDTICIAEKRLQRRLF